MNTRDIDNVAGVGDLDSPNDLVPPVIDYSAALKERISKMQERRKWSSGYYSVHVDELFELLSILEIIIERHDPKNVKHESTTDLP